MRNSSLHKRLAIQREKSQQQSCSYETFSFNTTFFAKSQNICTLIAR